MSSKKYRNKKGYTPTCKNIRRTWSILINF